MRALAWRKAAFYLLLTASLLTGLVTGQRVFYLVFGVLLLLLAFAYGMDFFTAFAFAYSQELDRAEAEKGEKVTLTVGIFNDLPYPFPMMKVHLTGIMPQDDEVFTFDLPARSSITLTHTVTCPYRGEYSVGIKEVEIHDVFGLTCLHFSMLRRPYYRPKPVLIHPKRVELPHLPGRDHDNKYFTGSKLRLASHGEELAGIREYQAGDSARRIHWKASARRRELMTRQYEVPMESGIDLLLDTSDAKKVLPPLSFFSLLRKKERQAREQALLTERETLRAEADLICTGAAALAGFHLKLGQGVRVFSCGQLKQPFAAHSVRGMSLLSKFLAKLPFSDKVSFHEAAATLLSRREEAPLYLITPRITGELSRELGRLAGRDRPVVCILTGTETPAALPGSVTLIHIPDETQITAALS